VCSSDLHDECLFVRIEGLPSIVNTVHFILFVQGIEKFSAF